MTDISLFIVGCIVTSMVLSAVGLLLWGAAQEPRRQPMRQPVPVRVSSRNRLAPRPEGHHLN